jgi:hypothetical protein
MTLAELLALQATIEDEEMKLMLQRQQSSNPERA